MTGPLRRSSGIRDVMDGADYGRQVDCSVRHKGILSAKIRPRIITMTNAPAKPTLKMLVAGSLAGGVSVTMAWTVYLAMVGATP